MIRRIRLKDWKSYDHLQLELGKGTHFVVAKNGVGKTSLLQAIDYGLFGDSSLIGSRRPIDRAIRAGRTQALVELGVELAGRAWSISRRLAREAGPREATAEFTVDGVSSSADEWHAALMVETGVDLAQLRLLCTVAEGETVPAASELGSVYNLVDHLSDVLGVVRLISYGRSLRRRGDELRNDADRERLLLRDRPERENQQDLASLTSRRETMRVRKQEVDATVEELSREVARARLWAEWETQSQQAIRKAETFARSMWQAFESLAPIVGTLEDSTALRDLNFFERATRLYSLLPTVSGSLQERRERVASELGRISERKEVAQHSISLLRAGDGICPTCGRPMTIEESTNAVQQSRDILTESESRERSLRDSLARIGSGQEAIFALSSDPPPRPPERPDGEPPTRALSESDIGRLEAMRYEQNSLTRELGEIDGEMRRIEEVAHQRMADRALSAALFISYRESDLSLAAASTFESLAATIATERIEPIAGILGKRWNELWPGRPRVTIDPSNGLLVADQHGMHLDLSDLSGGERAVALILLRLIALQTASRCPLLMLDEPLEHLDPRNRRLLASLLIAATRGRAVPEQIIVTTYEDSVTRRLSTGEPPDPTVTYVRAAEGDPAGSVEG